jgi:hypothetical protein
MYAGEKQTKSRKHGDVPRVNDEDKRKGQEWNV